MDTEKEATTEVGQDKPSQALQMFLHEGWQPIGGVNGGLAEGDPLTLGSFKRPTSERVGLFDLGPCNFSPFGESEGLLQAKSDSDLHDASLYDLPFPDDRRGGWEALQGLDVRFVGELDAEGDPEARF